jgi:hypothetical protein
VYVITVKTEDQVRQVCGLRRSRFYNGNSTMMSAKRRTTTRDCQSERRGFIEAKFQLLYLLQQQKGTFLT